MEYPTPQDLYPVVQDLTEVEYNNPATHTDDDDETGSCCCKNETFGSFALEDLVLPTTTPRTLLPATTTSSSRRPPVSPKASKGHKRGSSLFHFTLSPKSLAGTDTKKHRRSHSSPTDISEDTATTTTSHTSGTFSSIESEERVSTDKKKFEDTYVLTRQIYRCNVSSLWECINRELGTRHCVKIIDRRRFHSSDDEDCALKEVSMMTFLQSYSLVHLTRTVQVTEDLHHFYIVMELVEGTSLSNKLQQDDNHNHNTTTTTNNSSSSNKALTESQVQRLARSLLKAVQELHELGVCHYDLQPENILLEHNKEDKVVLCDFGSARFVNLEDDLSHNKDRPRRPHHRRRRSMQSQLGGNINYCAPELLTRYNYTSTLASDMWSVGVVLFQCLCGSLPFDDIAQSSVSSSSISTSSNSSSSRGRLKENIVKGNYSFCRKEWRFVTRGAKQFISSLLHTDHNVRLTVEEALAHPWLTTASPPLLVSPKSSKSSLSSPSSSSTKRKSRRSLVKRMLGSISSKRLSPETGNNVKELDLTTTASTMSSVGSVEDLARRRQLCA